MRGDLRVKGDIRATYPDEAALLGIDTQSFELDQGIIIIDLMHASEFLRRHVTRDKSHLL